MCKTMKADAPLHNHKDVRGFQDKLDMINPGGNRAHASTKGFPNVSAAPFYLREGLVAGRTVGGTDGRTGKRKDGQTDAHKDGRADR